MDCLAEWCLRRTSDADVERLQQLLGLPDVYRYLTDGVALPRWRIELWIELSHQHIAANGMGFWILERQDGLLGGCVELKKQNLLRSAELTYLLHPKFWGQGLATRMSWTVIFQALETGQVTQIVAGADEPNTASVSVMRRLGMTFFRRVEYPLGPGVEYIYRKGDPAPIPVPVLIPMSGESGITIRS